MANARNTDIETSHEAAASVTNITPTREYILKALRKPRTDSEMIEFYRGLKKAPLASESGLRSRRAELVEMGLVRDSGKRVRLESGRYSVVWEVVKA
jgi:hypothetical protein